MKSNAELILQGHFNQLKEELNRALQVKGPSEDEHTVAFLKKVFHYLRKRSENNALDPQGAELYKEAAIVLDNIQSQMVLPDKKPMKKAKGKKESGQKGTGRTGT